MEFVDNTGHIFSLKSYDEKPIGYEYEETPYIFWIDSDTSKLSVNNYYARPIYALYRLNENYDIENLQDDENSPIKISIEIEKSNVYKLIASKKLNEYLESDSYTNLNDYIDLNNIDDNTTYLNSTLTNKDLFVIKTTETIESENKNLLPIDFDYLVIPIYPIACANEEGVWITNIMIRITDENNHIDEWCPISVGGEFINEYEELVINGKNIGVELPKDILKAVYGENLYNDEFNEALYNEKLKEYLINAPIIRHECGNFRSAINSLKWFGYGDKLSISKLLKTDNELINQYLLDYFNIKNDIIDAFKNFKSDSLISIKLFINKDLDELYPFDVNSDSGFFGENKPKQISLLELYEKIKIGNHDMPIDNDDEKYWYWKPYLDFSFNELGIKLACLKQFYKKYFLPIHLYIHSLGLAYRVHTNDIKWTMTTGVSMTSPSIGINLKESEVEFSKLNEHYFTKQIHYVDSKFNEFTIQNVDDDSRVWYEINDTCVNIPIKFINNENNKGYFNCVFILTNPNISDKALYESHFSFCQNDSFSYKNFIIYPKRLNIICDRNEFTIKSKYYEYWVNDDYTLFILVNNRWYEYKFNLKIHNPTIDFGTLRYRYYLNEHNYLINRIKDTHNVHSLIFTDHILPNENPTPTWSNLQDINNYLYEVIEGKAGDIEKTFIKTIDLSDIDSVWQPFESNYDILSPFTQINKIDAENKRISFNSYMHNTQLVDVNNIDFDIDFYKILKYHLDHNLLYIDGTLLNREFYQFFIYNYGGKDHEVLLHKDLIGYDIEIPAEYFDRDKIIMCAWQDNLYILSETGENTNSYFINVLNDVNEYYVSEEGNEDDFDYALIFDSANFHYDEALYAYYTEDPITKTRTGTYFIYDKLYNNTDYIYNKYQSEVNLPNLSKYKNSMHLFDLYETVRSENNILIFHNDFNVYINGLQFTHGNYSHIENKEYDSLKIYINGKADNNEEDTRQLDIYGLHWIDNVQEYIENGKILNIPQEIHNNQYELGFYVKRDYYKHYDDPDNKIEKIYELPNIFEFDNKEFTYYESPLSAYVGSLYYRTLDDFKINKYYKKSDWMLFEDLDIFLEDDKFYFYDNELKDLNDLSKPYKYSLKYNIQFYDEDDNEIEVSLNDINARTYDHIEIKFFYQQKHIVRNRFYVLVDYLNEYLPQGYLFEFIDDTTLRITDNNGTTQDVSLIKLSPKYMYEDLIHNNYISNQNPAYYWYNVDKNNIQTLSSYLNELERWTYDAETESLEYILSQLDAYKEKFENKNPNDFEEARYWYYNYLTKDLTGKKGTYRLQLDHSINMTDEFDARLVVEIIDENDNKNIICHPAENSNGEFTLTGNEKNVTLYIQLKNLHNEDEPKLLSNYWILPRLYEVTYTDKKLEYNYEDAGTNYITAKFLNKEYYYGNNLGEYVYNLYNDFFKLKYNIYDAYDEDGNVKFNLLNSVYEEISEIKLNTYLDYDFYLMHDDKYWYGIYISEQTSNNARTRFDLMIPDENKRMEFDSKFNNTHYVLKHHASSEEFLLNRMEFISSNGFNQFKDTDIITCYVHNNDRLPINPYISSKWKITPLSLGMGDETIFDSNAEMTILSIPKNDSKYQKGYYKVTVKYSLDRDVQHQFKNTSTFRIS